MDMQIFVRINDNPFENILDVEELEEKIKEVIEKISYYNGKYVFEITDKIYENEIFSKVFTGKKLTDNNKLILKLIRNISEKTKNKYNFYFDIKYVDLDKIDLLESEELVKIDEILWFELAIKKIYINLEFKENISQDMETLSQGFIKSKDILIHHFKKLDRDLYDIKMNEIDFVVSNILARFKSQTGIDCSLEGNQEKVRKKLTFYFGTKNYKCEPHTKIEYLNVDKRGEYLYDRIYFNISKEESKIKIGYIGKHL